MHSLPYSWWGGIKIDLNDPKRFSLLFLFDAFLFCSSVVQHFSVSFCCLHSVLYIGFSFISFLFSYNYRGLLRVKTAFPRGTAKCIVSHWSQHLILILISKFRLKKILLCTRPSWSPHFSFSCCEEITKARAEHAVEILSRTGGPACLENTFNFTNFHLFLSDFGMIGNKGVPHFMPTGLSDCYTQVF